jgi:hypothetical protein
MWTGRSNDQKRGRPHREGEKQKEKRLTETSGENWVPNICDHNILLHLILAIHKYRLESAIDFFETNYKLKPTRI